MERLTESDFSIDMIDDVGKTVFLTRKETEQKLKGMNEESKNILKEQIKRLKNSKKNMTKYDLVDFLQSISVEGYIDTSISTKVESDYS